MKNAISVTIVIIFLVFAGCKDNKPEEGKTDTDQNNGLTGFQLINGIGPVTEKLELKPVDKKLALTGKEILEKKCNSCHNPDLDASAPVLTDVLNRRTPEFVVNMVLNPEENILRHPEMIKMRGNYFTRMRPQNISKEEALALLEYFRTLK